MERFLILRYALMAALLALALAAPLRAAPPPAKYEPSWESLRQHPLPTWYDDAKFGIFIHWGVYSVPGWAPPTGELGKVDWNRWFIENPYAEWYQNSMKLKDSPTWRHHVATYGERFDYLDFIPIFQREVRKWNPDDWARLFQQVGARYVVLTTKHHDGFTLWPSRVRNPHRRPEQQSTRRDLVGELTRAVRARGMRMGFYYSGGIDWSFHPAPIRTPNDFPHATPQGEEYARYADAHWRELIARYRPSILWNDITYPKKGDLAGIFATFYNTVPDGVVNDRWGAPFADFNTREYQGSEEILAKKWETCRGIGFSFGYNRQEGPEQMLSVDQLVELLVDTVSKNGNLLLNVGPRADGTIPELQAARLRGLGRWLAVNGEAIYSTRPWTRAAAKTAEGVDVRFTRKGETLYAILLPHRAPDRGPSGGATRRRAQEQSDLQRPEGAAVTLADLPVETVASVQLLGAKGDLTWRKQGKDLVVRLPSRLPASEAYALRIRLAPAAEEAK